MAGATAELRCFHMLDGSVGELGANQNVEHPGNSQKPDESLERGFAVVGRFIQSIANCLLSEIYPNRNQSQSGEEDQGKYQEEDYPNVGIVDVATNL